MLVELMSMKLIRRRVSSSLHRRDALVHLYRIELIVVMGEGLLLVKGLPSVVQ